eukprot:COSAG01_NODE_8543_length_2748_cov_1.661382_1_plen_176_part_00
MSSAPSGMPQAALHSHTRGASLRAGQPQRAHRMSEARASLARGEPHATLGRTTSFAPAYWRAVHATSQARRPNPREERAPPTSSALRAPPPLPPPPSRRPWTSRRATRPRGRSLPPAQQPRRPPGTQLATAAGRGPPDEGLCGTAGGRTRCGTSCGLRPGRSAASDMRPERASHR